MNSSCQIAKPFCFTEDNFSEIFNTYWRKLYSIAYCRLRDTELSKDLVQEVFVYCWQQRDSIRITSSIEAYLRTALQYQLVAHFRRLDINDRAFAYLYEQMVRVDTHMQDILTEQDLTKILHNQFDQMPETMREIFKLRIEEYTVVEIAQSLNLAEKTVRNNISKGLHQLRKGISKDFPEDFSAICFVLYLILT